MKVKLLRKLKKRFDYYLNKHDHYVIIDKDKDKVLIFSPKLTANYSGLYNVKNMKSKIDISVKKYCQRIAINHMLEAFGESYNDIVLNKAKRIAKRQKTKLQRKL